MKKILFAVPLLSVLLVACDPMVDEVGMDKNVTVEELNSAWTISQKSEGNNNLTFNLSPTYCVKVYDASNDAEVANGTAPFYQVTPPAREVSFYVTVINQDGTIVKSANKSVNVAEFTDLPEIFHNLFGDGNGGFTSYTWTWDNEAADGVVWGSGGYLDSSSPGWWKVNVDQLDSEAVNRGFPKDGLDGWMTIGPSSVETSRGETGRAVVSADVVKPGWDVAQISFTNTVPLLGIQPNEGNVRQYDYHILKADDSHLTLCAPRLGVTAQWGEAQFWMFKKK